MNFRTDVTLGMKNPLTIPLMNGAGCVKTVEDVRVLSQVPLIGSIVVGSFTLQARDVNPGEVFYSNIISHHDSDGKMRDYGYALNSLGMPNGGRKYLEQNLGEMVRIAHDNSKSLIVNIAGFTPREYKILFDIASENGADAIELNLGCPNVVTNNGGRKPIPSLDTESFRSVLMELNPYPCDEIPPVWVKVSPNVHFDQIKELAKWVSEFNFVNSVTTTNTLPNSFAITPAGKSRITVGSAGLSGPALKPLALSNTLEWRKLLPERKNVIAVGGISRGDDIRDYINVGASAFQITTALLQTGRLDPVIFERIVTEFNEL